MQNSRSLTQHRETDSFIGKLSTGIKGWVWAKKVEVSDEEDVGESDTVEDDVIAKLLAAHTDPIEQPLVINGQTVCRPTGNPGDDNRKIALNANKNRTDIPQDTAYVRMDWADLRDLPVNHSSDLPGAPVLIENVFLVHRVKSEGAESPNCGLTDPDEVDWHIYTSDTAGSATAFRFGLLGDEARGFTFSDAINS